MYPSPARNHRFGARFARLVAVALVAAMSEPQRVRQALAYAAWLAYHGLEIDLDTVLAAYPAGRYSSVPTALGTAMSDFMPGGGLNSCLFLRTAWLASRWVPVYQYEFADDAAPPVMNDPGIELGAVHTSEMPYQFAGFSNTSVLDGPPLAARQQELARQMAA